MEKMYIKTYFDASNLIKQKLHNDWLDDDTANNSFEKYLRTKKAKSRLVYWLDRYFKKIESNANILDVNYKSVSMELEIWLELESINDFYTIKNNEIFFY